MLKFHQGYQFPNQSPQYLDKAIKFSNYNHKKPSILCVGGVFYAHYLKAKFPNSSYVEAVDNNEISVTGQCLSALNNIYQSDKDYIRLIQLGLPAKNYNSTVFDKSYIKRVYEMLSNRNTLTSSKNALFDLFTKHQSKHPWLTKKKIEKYIKYNLWQLTRPTCGNPKLIKELKVDIPDKITLGDITKYKTNRKYNFISTNNVVEQARDAYDETLARVVFSTLINVLQVNGILEMSTNSKKVKQAEFINMITKNSKPLLFIDENGKMTKKYTGPSFSTKALTQSKKYNTVMEVVIVKKSH